METLSKQIFAFFKFQHSHYLDDIIRKLNVLVSLGGFDLMMPKEMENLVAFNAREVKRTAKEEREKE